MLLLLFHRILFQLQKIKEQGTIQFWGMYLSFILSPSLSILCLHCRLRRTQVWMGGGGGWREVGMIPSLLLLKGSCNYDPLLVYFNRERKKSRNNEIVVNIYLAPTLWYLSTSLKHRSDLTSAQTAFQIHSSQTVSERTGRVSRLNFDAGTNIMINTVNKQKRKENNFFCWFKRDALCPVGLINLLLRLQSGSLWWEP